MKDLLSIFHGRCSHRWVGATNGYHACPVCGDCDGEGHLVEMTPIPVQADDWGEAWHDLDRESTRRQRKRRRRARNANDEQLSLF
jgi:hypothetical protein